MTRVATLGVVIRIVLAIALPAAGFWLKAFPMPAEYDFEHGDQVPEPKGRRLLYT